MSKKKFIIFLIFCVIVLAGGVSFAIFKHGDDVKASDLIFVNMMGDEAVIYAVEDESYNYFEVEFELRNAELSGVSKLLSSWRIDVNSIGRSENVDSEGNVVSTREYIRAIFIKTDDSYEKKEKRIGKISFRKINGLLEDYQVVYHDIYTVKKVNLNKYDMSAKIMKNNKEIASVKDGEEFDYIINIKGMGNYYNDKNVTVSTTIPDDLEIVSSDATSANNQTLTWGLGVPSKGGYEKQLNVKVKAKKLGTYNNDFIMSVGDDKTTISKTVAVSNSNVELKITPSATSATPNDVFYYNFNIKNTGNIKSGKISVNSLLDSNLKLLSASKEYSNTNNNYTFSIDPLAPNGEETIRLKVQVNGNITAKTIENKTTITETGKESILVTKNINVYIPKLSLNISSSKTSVKRGDETEISVTLANNGDGNAKNVKIDYNIDENFEIINKVGESTIENLSPGKNSTLKLKLKAKNDSSVGSTNNIVTVTSSNHANLTKNINLTIVDSKLEMTSNISKNNIEGNNVIKPNEEFNYKIKIKNTGTSIANNVTINKLINNNIEFISAYDEKTNETINLTANENSVNFVIGNININEEKNIIIKAKVKKDAKFNQILDTQTNLFENGVEKISTAEKIIISDSDVYFLNEPSTLKVSKDELVTYKIKVINSGNEKAENITIKTFIPKELENVKVSVKNDFEIVKENSNEIITTISSLEAEETKEFEITAKVKNNVQNDDEIVLKSILTNKDKEFESSSSIKVIDSILSISLKSSVSEIKSNEEFYYTIKITNSGNKDASSVVLINEVDKLLSILDSSSGAVDNNVITWTIDNIPKQSSKTITIKVKTGKITENTKLVNKVTLKGNDKETSETMEVLLKKDNIENPRTGNFISLISILILLVAGVFLVIIPNRKRILRHI